MTANGTDETRPGGKRLRGWGLAVLKIAVALVIGWLILRTAGVSVQHAWPDDWNLNQADWYLLGISLLLVGVFCGLNGWLWARIVVALGGPSVPLSRAAAALLVANLGRYVPGKILHLVGLAVVARRVNVPGVVGVAAAVTNQFLQLAAAGITGGWLIVERTEVDPWTGLVGMAVALVATVAFVRLGGAGFVLGWAMKRAGHEDHAEVQWGKLLVWFPGFLLNWGILGLGFYCLSHGLGLGISLVAATTAFAGSYLVGYAAWFIPAGLVIRESFLLAALTPLLGAEGGAILAGMQRVWITVAEFAGAFAGALLLRRSGGAARPRNGMAIRARKDTG